MTTRTFYIGAANDGSVEEQSVEADLEGFQGMFSIMGIPTFNTEADLDAARNPNFVGKTQVITVTVQIDE